MSGLREWLTLDRDVQEVAAGIELLAALNASGLGFKAGPDGSVYAAPIFGSGNRIDTWRVWLAVSLVPRRRYHPRRWTAELCSIGDGLAGFSRVELACACDPVTAVREAAEKIAELFGPIVDAVRANEANDD